MPAQACPPEDFGLGAPPHPRDTPPGPGPAGLALTVDSPVPWSPKFLCSRYGGGHKWRGDGRQGFGREKAADQETEGERGNLAGLWPGPGRAQKPRGGSSALRQARVGQCHLAPGNRRHFLRADRWLALGGGVLGAKPRNWPRDGWGQRHPSGSPSALAEPSGLEKGDGGQVSRAGAGMGGAWHATSAAGAFPPPSPRARWPGCPRAWLCPHPQSLSPRAIARPP